MTEEVTREQILNEGKLDPLEQLLKREQDLLKASLPAEEVPVEEKIEVKAVEEAKAESKYSEIELEAMKQGWKPKDQLEDGKPFKDAQRYLDDGKLFEKIEQEKAARKRAEYEYKKELAEIRKQMADSQKAGYEQALLDIQRLRDEAEEAGDLEAFKIHDAKTRDLEQRIEAVKAYQPAPNPVLVPEVQEFVERNSDWFNDSTDENKRMVEAAKHASTMIALSNPGISGDKELALVEKEIKRLFPHRFANEKKEAPAPVARAPDGTFASKTSVASSKTSLKYEDLNPLQKQACRTLLEMDPKATVEDYLVGLEQVINRTRN